MISKVHGVTVGLDPQPVTVLRPLADYAPRCSVMWGPILRRVLFR